MNPLPPVRDRVHVARKVADAGAELILFTALFDVAEHAKRIATEIFPGIAGFTRQ